jgi:hypothetical protein
MNILETLLTAGGGNVVGQLARQFGTQPDATQNAVTQIVSVLSKGMANNTASPSGLEGLLGALANGNHARYLDDPTQATTASGIDDGNGILGHILGSKDVSRELASRVGANTGVDSSIIKKMLPVIATMMMGALAKRGAGASGGGGLGSLLGAAVAGGALGGGAQSGLGSLLDMNHDGSIADDILGMAGKFLRR